VWRPGFWVLTRGVKGWTPGPRTSPASPGSGARSEERRGVRGERGRRQRRRRTRRSHGRNTTMGIFPRELHGRDDEDFFLIQEESRSIE
jgi:hypothetical protein